MSIGCHLPIFLKSNVIYDHEDILMTYGMFYSKLKSSSLPALFLPLVYQASDQDCIAIS